MVLGVTIMKSISISVLFLLVACSYAASPVIDKTSLFANSFEIEQENNQCFLVYNNHKKLLTPQPPCYFVRDTSEKLRYFSYSDIGVDAVLIIIGTLVSNKERKEWGLDKETICGTEAQGILIKGDTVSVTSTILQGGLLCRNTGVDEKNFWELAHER